MGSKINRLMQVWPAGVVGTQRWLHRQGVDARLAGKYVRSGWLTRIGRGAYRRAGSAVDWPGAVHALQHQLHLDVHPGDLDLARVDFGSGKRTIHPGGRLDARYHLVVEDPYHA